MTQKKSARDVNVNERYMLFRSCAVSNKYPGIEAATKSVFEALNIQLEVSDEHTCCGGSAFIFTAIGQVTSTMLMTARNLAISEEMKLDTLTMCNGCYKNLNEFGKYIKQNQAVMQQVNGRLNEINRNFIGSSSVYHVMEILYSKRHLIREVANKSFNGLRFAVHYGCHYSFAAKENAIDDPFSTVAMEEIIEMLGGEIVNYAEEKTCCGSGILNNTYIKSEASIPAAMNKLDSLNSTKADAVIVMCPYCMMSLDRMQFQLKMNAKKDYIVPVLHIAQLVGLAFGESPVNLGFDVNLTATAGFIQKWEALHA